MHLGVHRAVVTFLVYHQTIRAGLNQRKVILRFHRTQFQGNGRHLGAQRADAIGQVLPGDKFGVFARHQQDVAETLFPQRPHLAQDVLDAESHTDNGIVAGKTAVFTIIDTLVGEVKRREKADGMAEAPPRQRLRTACQFLQVWAGGGGDQTREIRHG